MPKIEKYKIIYSPAALNHVAKIVTWYNIQKTGLGTKFKEALKITLIKLKQNPFVKAVRYDEVRFALAQTFPYAVHYTIVSFIPKKHPANIEHSKKIDREKCQRFAKLKVLQRNRTSRPKLQHI